MKNIVGLCDRDTAIGLKLAGIKKVYVPEEDNVKKTFYEIVDNEDAGVVFINEKYAERLGKELKEYRLRNDIPVVVEIPDKKGWMEDRVDFISDLTKKAVGIRIDKKE
ncbi:MAG: V-type ATP synthase subunit F [Candidatus Thermoplasmatota archaeon]